MLFLVCSQAPILRNATATEKEENGFAQLKHVNAVWEKCEDNFRYFMVSIKCKGHCGCACRYIVCSWSVVKPPMMHAFEYVAIYEPSRLSREHLFSFWRLNEGWRRFDNEFQY